MSWFIRIAPERPRWGHSSSSPPKRARLKHSVNKDTPSLADEDNNDDGDDKDADLNDDDAFSNSEDDALTSSRFLSSLNVGFTRGESDGSDWSRAENDDNVATGNKRRTDEIKEHVECGLTPYICILCSLIPLFADRCVSPFSVSAWTLCVLRWSRTP